VTPAELASAWVGGAAGVVAVAGTLLLIGRWRWRWALLEPAAAIVLGIALWQGVGAWGAPPPPRAALLGLVALLHLSPRLPSGRWAILTAALVGPLSATAMLAPRAKNASEAWRLALGCTAVAALSPLGGPLMALMWSPSWALWVAPWSLALLAVTGLPDIAERKEPAAHRPLRFAVATGLVALAVTHAGVAGVGAMGLAQLPTALPEHHAATRPVIDLALGALAGLIDPWWTAPVVAHVQALAPHEAWRPMLFGAVANPLLALLIAARACSWRTALYAVPLTALALGLAVARLLL